ncbi:MAG: 50S ribosomal protein L11 methyltransferase [Chloroflexi bacterium]|nr:50S ribosomal protein L11 methyltransferase [Chloroflexota bacterium]
MNWLEVSLTVNGELAEAVADVLARFAPNGVTTEQAVKFNDEEDEGTPVGPVTVRAYLPADEKLEETRQKLEESLSYLGMIQPLPAPVFTPLADQNWMEAWKVRYQPIPIGKRLIIVPAWLESPDASRISIKIDPGMAFGTGTHPTTQLCLELIEEQFYADRPQTTDDGPSSVVRRPSSIIDIGCGSGILSVAALKLGADFALGVDIDEASVKASRENADANGIRADQFSIGLGSVTEVLAGRFQALSRGGSRGIRNAPLVLANILAPIIIRLFDLGLAELVSPGGALILSGILAEQAEGVIYSAEVHGLKLVERRQIGDWVALLVR